MSGEANKVTGFTAFSNDPNEQEGYYAPLTFQNWEGVEVISSRRPENRVKLTDDGDLLLFLGKEDITPGLTLTVYPPEGEEFSYSFNGVTKAEE